MNAPRVVLFHRDLRLHDNPALAAAAAGDGTVVPLFVVDPRLPAGPNRLRFLREALADLRTRLRERGADLVVRGGDPVAEAIRLATEVNAAGIDAAADASRYARAREQRLATECDRHRRQLRLHPGVTVVPPGELRPSSGGDHYRVFTPYWRVWQEHRWRAEQPAPGRLQLPPGVTGTDPARLVDEHAPGPVATDRISGGESAALRRLDSWLPEAGSYPDRHDDLPADATSRLSAYLHFGCLSARALAGRCAGHPEYVRQLCWRDFYHQVLAAFPELPRRAYRPGAAERWSDDPDALTAWCHGRTGIPVVDAGMRQLTAEGYLPNRARLITAGYLTKVLGLDWRAGADWYHHLLVDADVANNYGNWQWVAGTGNDTRPYRGFNPVRQARRFDPDGDYVRRWVTELAEVAGPEVHEPWRLPARQRQQLPYPPSWTGAEQRPDQRRR